VAVKSAYPFVADVVAPGETQDAPAFLYGVVAFPGHVLLHRDPDKQAKIRTCFAGTSHGSVIVEAFLRYPIDS
jgi:hypothetical protein